MSEVVGLALSGLAGGGLGLWLRFPLGGLLGSIVGAGVFHLLSDGTATVGRPVLLCAQLVVGTVVGASLDRDVFRTLRTIMWPVVVLCVSLLALTAALGWFVLHGWGPVDPITGFLSAAPAGATEMGTTALVLGARSEVVLVAHILRMLAVGLIGATLVPYLVRRYGSRG